MCNIVYRQMVRGDREIYMIALLANVLCLHSTLASKAFKIKIKYIKAMESNKIN